MITYMCWKVFEKKIGIIENDVKKTISLCRQRPGDFSRHLWARSSVFRRYYFRTIVNRHVRLYCCDFLAIKNAWTRAVRMRWPSTVSRVKYRRQWLRKKTIVIRLINISYRTDRIRLGLTILNVKDKFPSRVPQCTYYIVSHDRIEKRDGKRNFLGFLKFFGRTTIVWWHCIYFHYSMCMVFSYYKYI